MSLYEKMEVQHIGAFIRDYPLETASHLELQLLYLNDFVASVIQSHNMEEAEVLFYIVCQYYVAFFPKWFLILRF